MECIGWRYDKRIVMFSYWEKQSFLHYDYIVIGAGVVGLSVAIELQEKNANAQILTLERGLLPTGASTRNAGFACMGSATELLDDLQHTSEQEALELFAERKKGLERLRNRLGDSNIGYATNGSYELINENELPALEQLEYLNRLIKPITGIAPFALANKKIAEFGFDTDYTKSLIQNTCEGELHSGKMMRALQRLAMQKGIEIKTSAMATGFDEDADGVDVHVIDPFRNQRYSFRCRRLIVCTNAFTKTLLPGADVIPGRGQVLVTEPVPGLRFKGIYHFDKGYYYFREIDGRVLFGGGRNLDFEGEATTDFSLNERIQRDLEEKLRTIILPGSDVAIAQRWAGIMAFGQTKRPIVQAFTDRVFGGFRMGGMGVALGSQTAAQTAALVAQRDE